MKLSKKKLKVLNDFGIGKNKTVNYFNILGLNNRIDYNKVKTKHTIFINKKLSLIGKGLKKQIKNNILFLIKNKSYRGLRAKFKYPSRGQRTHTNAKTKKKFVL